MISQEEPIHFPKSEKIHSFFNFVIDIYVRTYYSIDVINMYVHNKKEKRIWQSIQRMRLIY